MSKEPQKALTTKSSSWEKTREVFSSILLPLAIFFVAQLSLAIVLSPFIPGLIDEDRPLGIEDNFVYSVSFQLFALALVAWYLKLRGKNRSWLGYKKFKLKYLSPVLPAALVYIVLTVGAFMVVALLVQNVNLDQEQIVGFEGATSWLENLLAFVSLVIITPITEETLIRGIMFRRLKRVAGFTAAALASATIFALLHGQLNVGIDTFILGLVLAWLVNKTDTIWPAIALHMLKNFVAFSFLYLV